VKPTLCAAALLLLLLLLTTPVAAQDSCPCPPPPPPPPLWTGSLGFSYLATSGNSDSSTVGLTTSWARKATPWGAELQATVTRAEAEGKKTAERLYGAVRGKRALGERLELFTGLSYERDPFAGFDSRVVGEVGGLWKAWRGPVHLLDFDLGLTWTREEPTSGSSRDYPGALAGATYTWVISKTSSFRERLVLLPNFDDSDDWRLRAETSLEAALASAWALRLGFLATRDNQPTPGFEKDDTATSISVVWKR
jgi:putative salt-induced outer membrane protein YdiY